MKHSFTHKLNIGTLSVLLSLGLSITPGYADGMTSEVAKEPSTATRIHNTWEDAPDSEWPTEEQPLFNLTGGIVTSLQLTNAGSETEPTEDEVDWTLA